MEENSGEQAVIVADRSPASRTQSARLETAERIVPVETTNSRARISDLIEPLAVQSDRKSL